MHRKCWVLAIVFSVFVHRKICTRGGFSVASVQSLCKSSFFSCRVCTVKGQRCGPQDVGGKHPPKWERCSEGTPSWGVSCLSFSLSGRGASVCKYGLFFKLRFQVCASVKGVRGAARQWCKRHGQAALAGGKRGGGGEGPRHGGKAAQPSTAQKGRSSCAVQ